MTDKGIIHDSAELRRLIAENPDLPIVVLAGEYAHGGYYGWWFCANVWAEVCEVLDCDTPCRDDYIYSDRDDFEDDMENWLCDVLDTSLLTQDEFIQTVKAEIAKYEPYWKKVIAIRADN